MKGIIVEKKDGFAVLVDKKGGFHKMKDRNDLAIGSEYEKRTFIGFNKSLVLKFSALAIVGTLGLTGYNAYAIPKAYVTLDINPSVELATNSFGTVIDVNALNEDGQIITENLPLEGEKVEDALQTLIDEAKTEGYLSEDTENAVAVTVSTDDEAKEEEITQSVEEAVKSELEDQNLPDTEVVVQNINTERHKEAERLGISPGKMLLIEKLQAVIPEANADDYANKPVREIMKTINAEKAENRAESKEAKKAAKDEKKTDKSAVDETTEQPVSDTTTESSEEAKNINNVDTTTTTNTEKKAEQKSDVKEKVNNDSNENKQGSAQEKSKDNTKEKTNSNKGNSNKK